MSPRRMWVSWATAQRAVEAHAARELGEPEPTPLLGIDETRFGRPRWTRTGDESGEGRWVRLELWETGFVDLRCPTADGQGRLGQVDGRSGATLLPRLLFAEGCGVSSARAWRTRCAPTGTTPTRGSACRSSMYSGMITVMISRGAQQLVADTAALPRVGDDDGEEPRGDRLRF
jgi:hypothetical protein